MVKIGDVAEIEGEATMEWTIKDFLSSLEAKNLTYLSRKFYFSGSSWQLWMYLKSHPEGEELVEWICLYLFRTSFGSPINLNISFCLKTVDGRTKPELNFTKVFHEKNRGYGTPKFLSISELMERKSELIPSNDLTVICTLKGSQSVDVADSIFCRLQDLSDKLKDIFENDKTADITLKVNEQNICAHRVILETRSPVFSAIINHDTNGDKIDQIPIENLDENSLKSILLYQYCGDVDKLTTENALSLYSAAEMYDIKLIKKMCLKFILQNLSAEWVCEVIKFADLYHEDEIARRSRDYFKEHAGKIIESDNFKLFVKENHDVGFELLTSVIKSLLPK